MNLINEIQAKGLCHRCGEDTANAISLTEAKEIMELVKGRCIEAIEKKYKNMMPNDNAVHIASINTGLDTAIKAIEGVE